MTETAIAMPEPPRMAVRIGITGARRLSPAQVDRIEAQLSEVLQCVKARMYGTGRSDTGA